MKYDPFRRLGRFGLLGWLLPVLCSLSYAAPGDPESVNPAVSNRLTDPAFTPTLPLISADFQSPGAVFTSAGGSAKTSESTLQAGDLQLLYSGVGYSFSSGSPDFNYGDEITPPLERLDGSTMTLADARDYWRAEPVRKDEGIQVAGALTNDHFTNDELFYYSPHAERVFASHPGRISMRWVTAADDGDNNFEISEVQIYNIGRGTTSVIREIYWTEFSPNAPAVEIPTGIVQELNLIYNNDVPANVPSDERVIPNGTQELLVSTRTVWVDTAADRRLLRAHNLEGQVLIEYLGNLRGSVESGEREHLGIEVLEVRRELAPIITQVVIGEQLVPSDGVRDLDESILVPVQQSLPGNLVAQHFQNQRTVYYAVAENDQAPNVEFYWLEPGTISVPKDEAGVSTVGVDDFNINWPKYRNYYEFIWPENISDFEGIFARPDDSDDAEGSFLNLIATNSPLLIYQDDPNGNQANLDFQFRFSANLDNDTDASNRSLIRLNNGNDFFYIRLYSGTTSHLETLDLPGETFDPTNLLDVHLTRTATVGTRLTPPDPSLSLGGYIAPDSGNAYDVGSYVNPFGDGGLEAANNGAIIPINTIPSDQLSVWWFRELSPPARLADLFSPIYIPSVQVDYTISYPGSAREIILASNNGSGELSSLEAAGSIYSQNDKAKPGYNPNEEHAVMIAGRAYALRDDLNTAVSSEGFVLVSHEDEDGRPDMSVFKVFREKDDIVFDYPAIAGRLLQAPFPLPIIPQPITADGETANEEVTVEDIDGVPAGRDNSMEDPDLSVGNLAHYNRFTFTDRKGSTWVYRGPHDPESIPAGSEPKLSFQYYYKTVEGFAFPDSTGVDQPPAVGTIVPYLSPAGSTDPIGDGIPLTITFTPSWPEQTPVLHYAETLGQPKFGLPGILGATSAQLVYQQSIAEDIDAVKNSVILHDSTINRVSHLSGAKLEALPADLKTTFSRGKTFFQNLPSHLESRLFFDSLIGTAGALVFTGEYVDEPVGEDFVLPNTLSEAEVTLIKELSDEAKWGDLVDGLTIQPEFRKRLDDGSIESMNLAEYLEEKSFNEILGQTISESVSATALPEAVDPDQVIASYLITAVGGGEGYVTLVTGNGEVNSEPGEPVQMHIFRAGEKLYQGELKPQIAGNPLSESVTVQHTGDFAARTNNYEFQWKKSPPVNGLAPEVFIFDQRTLPGGFTGLKSFRNVATTAGTLTWGDEQVISSLPQPVELNPSGSDLTQSTYRITGSLDLSGELDAANTLSDVFISLRLDSRDGAIVLVKGVEALRYQALSGVNSETAPSVPGGLSAFLTGEDDTVVFKLPGRSFLSDVENTVEILYNSTDPVGDLSPLDIRFAITVKQDASSNYFPVATEAGKNRHTVSGSGIDTLGDNYYIMRYRPLEGHELYVDEANPVWSDWTRPALVEGWIKRVLAGINPFNQRVTDFFENAVNTNVSILTQAGTRWEGDIALNLGAVQDTGLIEIYETVLKRGINLSINGTPQVDYAPANDALLLAAGYLNDLYIALGNEAFADAANPTVSFDGQALGTLGDAAITAGFEENFRNTATSRFAFQGQVSTLLDEELSLLRGRDDFLSPSIEIAPVYNRLFWNYTRGIDAGELIYALNYNIREQNDAVADGRVDAADAARMFPQSHGDAYGHYLTAIKNYYRLLTDPDFTWGTRIEAVNVLGQPVSIDYFDERKFAAASGAIARTADQILGLERRKAFELGNASGWSHLSDGRFNERTNRTRRWGVDDWAARGGQGAYFHWVVGNSIIPDEDLVNEGIQKIDRTTVPELNVVAQLAAKIQGQMDGANQRVNPLDLSNESLLVDISPAELSGGKTHFEQIYERALQALENANSVFTRASDSTRLLRSLENQSQNLTQIVDDEETAFINQLIAIFGEPYPGDIGPGKPYPQGYAGPDVNRYMLIDRPFDVFSKAQLFSYKNGSREFTLNVNNAELVKSLDNSVRFGSIVIADTVTQGSKTIKYTLRENEGPYILADPSLGTRPSIGSLQTSLNELRLAEEQLYVGLASMDKDFALLRTNLLSFEIEMLERSAKQAGQLVFDTAKFVYEELLVAIEALDEASELTVRTKQQIVGAATQSLPTVVGVSSDVSAPARALILAADIASQVPVTVADVANATAEATADFVFLLAEKTLAVANLAIDEEAFIRGQISRVKGLYSASLARTREVDSLQVAYTRALEKYRTELANGRTALANREVFRRRAAAAVQGYRTRDLAFRTFRTEALEEYQTLLEWASRYAFLAAQTYDYETGLLGSEDGQAFLGKIVSSRALGILDDNGRPTIAASSNGDPGLSGLLARLKTDYDVVKGRLGFNNPETNGTTFSLRREYFRIPEGPEGDLAWREQLEALVNNNLLTDADIAIHALQLGDAANLQPGFLISFPTVIEDGKNFFGKDLLAGDSTFTTSHFATKVHSVGVVFDGYQGIAPCEVCANGPGDPTHNHEDALSATPYVYLLPAGLDTMRTPPLGDSDVLRTWKVDDYAVPLPFNIGGVSDDERAATNTNLELVSQFRAPRRHASFRATDRAEFFFTDFAEDYTSSRLVGRSAWNSNWKLVIPAKGLLANEQDGVGRFIRTVKDIKLHLKTYSYSGN